MNQNECYDKIIEFGYRAVDGYEKYLLSELDSNKLAIIMQNLKLNLDKCSKETKNDETV
jgi:hypothetical protein|tara:strand:+ start:820 stop:996 length:177 start_codon:yes stop_codon:yes gene_type:complete